jgi:hypothetical protein
MRDNQPGLLTPFPTFSSLPTHFPENETNVKTSDQCKNIKINDTKNGSVVLCCGSGRMIFVGIGSVSISTICKADLCRTYFRKFKNSVQNVEKYFNLKAYERYKTMETGTAVDKKIFLTFQHVTTWVRI